MTENKISTRELTFMGLMTAVMCARPALHSAAGAGTHLAGHAGHLFLPLFARRPQSGAVLPDLHTARHGRSAGLFGLFGRFAKALRPHRRLYAGLLLHHIA